MQKWGNRRYQNKDGSLTPLGRIHYGIGKKENGKEAAKKMSEEDIKKAVNRRTSMYESEFHRKIVEDLVRKYGDNPTKDPYNESRLASSRNRLKKLREELDKTTEERHKMDVEYYNSFSGVAPDDLREKHYNDHKKLEAKSREIEDKYVKEHITVNFFSGEDLKDFKRFNPYEYKEVTKEYKKYKKNKK